MLKKITLETLEVVGMVMTLVAALSGIVMYLSGGRADPTIVWFAPLFLTPLAITGIVLMLIGSLVSKKDRGILGWSVLAFAVVFAGLAAIFQFSGLASGGIEMAGTAWGTTALIVSYLYIAVMLGVAGVGGLVARDIIRMEPHRHHAEPTS